MSMKSNPESYWEKLAQRRIEEDFYAAQASLAISAAKLHMRSRGAKNASSKAIIEGFVNKMAARAENYDQAFAKVNSTGSWTLAKFAIINAQLRELIGP
jgi:NAD-specific glutamate dehydrogenase